MRPARVLKLVDQHVPIARLDPEAALGEFVEVLQQLHGALEDA